MNPPPPLPLPLLLVLLALLVLLLGAPPSAVEGKAALASA